MEALTDFPKRSLDFIYIDANHGFGYVAMDLSKWADKVRRHGIIAGHDYYAVTGSKSIRGVGPAVDGFIKSNDFANFYVLGSKNPAPGEKNDDRLSYMMFKHW